MTKYLKGSKRLAIIQRWLQGIDDPNYDVLPTKKEGKYIVKKKEQTPPLTQTDEPEQDEHEQVEPEQQEPEREQQEQEQEEPPPPVKPIRRPTRQPPRTSPIQHNRIGPQYVDSTVNLEILEQLKLLGDEIRTKRERKEQKQLIKQVVQKQLRTQPMNEPRAIPLEHSSRVSQRDPKSKPVEEYEYYSDDEEQPIIFKSRIFH